VTIGSDQSVTFVGSQTLSGGTANGVLYLNGSKAATSGSALTFDGTNLSVGAQGEVRVYNTANTRYGRFVTTSAGTLLQSFNGSGEPLILDAPQASAYISFNVNSTEQMRLNTTGLGIGTSSPAAKLHVSAPDGTAPLTLNTAGGSDSTRALNFNVAGDNYGKILIASASGGAMAFWTGGANAAAERMRLDSSGNLGVGTAQIRARLTVSDGTTNAAGETVYEAYIVGAHRSNRETGNLTIQSNDAMAINKGGSIAFGGRALSADASGANWASIAGLKENGTSGSYLGYLSFVTRGPSDVAERARITSGGEFLVGTTSATGKFTVNGANSSLVADFIETSGVPYIRVQNGTQLFGLGVTASTGWVGAISNHALTFRTNNTECARFDSTGKFFSLPTYNNTTGAAANLGVDSTAGVFYRSTSSLKYKRDVRDYDKGLATLMTLRSVYYKGTSERDGDTQYAGLIAEEVHDAGLPEFVQYAEDGTPDALAYGHMVSLLTKAIQEQQAIIQQLQADVAALKGTA
jgi:hypothetical protein